MTTAVDEGTVTTTVEAIAALPRGTAITVLDDGSRVTWTADGEGNLADTTGRILPATFFRGAAVAGRVHVPGVAATEGAAPTWAERMRLAQPLAEGEVMVYVVDNESHYYCVTEVVAQGEYRVLQFNEHGGVVGFTAETFTSVLVEDAAPSRQRRWSRLSAAEAQAKFPWLNVLPLAKRQYVRPRLVQSLISHANNNNDEALMSVLANADIGVNIHESPITVQARTLINAQSVPPESVGVDGEVDRFLETEIAWHKDYVVSRVALGDTCTCYDFNSAHVATLLPDNATYRDYRLNAH